MTRTPTFAEATLLADLAETDPVLGAADPIETRPIARERLLAAALGDKRFSPVVRAELKALYSLSDEQLDGLVQRINTASEWTATPLPGIDLMSVTGEPLAMRPDLPGTVALLSRFEAGTTFPMHQHVGEERVLVLEGGFTTSDGETIREGELLPKQAGSQHSFTADDDGDCITASLSIDGIRFG